MRQHTDNEIHFSHRRCRRRTTDVAAIPLGFRVARWSFSPVYIHSTYVRVYVYWPVSVSSTWNPAFFFFSPASSVDDSYAVVRGVLRVEIFAFLSLPLVLSSLLHYPLPPSFPPTPPPSLFFTAAVRTRPVSRYTKV